MKFPLPNEDVIGNAIEALEEGLAIDVVNSDNDVKNMLDDHGELRRRAPMNVFIGGQALDRGITIKGLIGFYYGRNPGRFQQDTVLQHSRMYGNRSMRDLSVTRFYTTGNVYRVLRRINESDEVLRNALSQDGDHGIVFIQQDQARQIVPCAPNKILLSSTTTLRPEKRLLPYGFDLLPGYKIKDYTTHIDHELQFIVGKNPELVSIEKAEELIVESFKAFDPKRADNMGHDCDEILAAIKYLSGLSENPASKKMVYVLVRRDRNVSRMRIDGDVSRPQNSPETGHEESEVARRFGEKIPVLIMLRQNGGEKRGWRSGHFWWPLLWVPTATHPAIYASETQEFIQEI